MGGDQKKRKRQATLSPLSGRSSKSRQSRSQGEEKAEVTNQVLKSDSVMEDPRKKAGVGGGVLGGRMGGASIGTLKKRLKDCHISETRS